MTPEIDLNRYALNLQDRQIATEAASLARMLRERLAGMLINVSKMDFSLSFGAESFAVSGCKLPEVEDAETPRVLFEERIALLRELGKTLDAMFTTFLTMRASTSWDAVVGNVRKWILSNSKAKAA
jgi:hypothetical protein